MNTMKKHGMVRLLMTQEQAEGLRRLLRQVGAAFAEEEEAGAMSEEDWVAIAPLRGQLERKTRGSFGSVRAGTPCVVR